MRLVTERIPRRFGLHPVDDIQVLTPMNRGGLGRAFAERRAAATAQPQRPAPNHRFGWTYAPGDKVIQTVNNYDKEVFNGDIGRIGRIDVEEGLVIIDFDGRAVVVRDRRTGRSRPGLCHQRAQDSGIGISRPW